MNTQRPTTHNHEHHHQSIFNSDITGYDFDMEILNESSSFCNKKRENDKSTCDDPLVDSTTTTKKKSNDEIDWIKPFTFVRNDDDDNVSITADDFLSDGKQNSTTANIMGSNDDGTAEGCSSNFLTGGDSLLFERTFQGLGPINNTDGEGTRYNSKEKEIGTNYAKRAGGGEGLLQDTIDSVSTNGNPIRVAEETTHMRNNYYRYHQGGNGGNNNNPPTMMMLDETIRSLNQSFEKLNNSMNKSEQSLDMIRKAGLPSSFSLTNKKMGSSFNHHSSPNLLGMDDKHQNNKLIATKPSEILPKRQHKSANALFDMDSNYNNNKYSSSSSRKAFVGHDYDMTTARTFANHSFHDSIQSLTSRRSKYSRTVNKGGVVPIRRTITRKNVSSTHFKNNVIVSLTTQTHLLNGLRRSKKQSLLSKFQNSR